MELDPSLGNPARARKGKQRATKSQESKEDRSRTREDATYAGRTSQRRLV